MVSLAGRPRAPRGLSGFGLGDAVADLTAQLNATNDQITVLNNRMVYLQSEYNKSHYGGQSPAQMQVFYDQVTNQLIPLQAKATSLANQITAIQQKAQSDAQAAADKAAVVAATPPTAAATAQALRDSVSQQQSLVEIAMGAKYDYGRGSSKRTGFYQSGGLADAPATPAAAARSFDLTSYLVPNKETSDIRSIPNWELTGLRPALGGNMQRILDMHRPGLGFDVFGAIEQGAKAGYAKYAASPAAAGGSSLPAVNIPNPFAGILPDWLAKAQLPASVRDIGGGVISSVTKAATAPAPSSAVAQTTVRTAPARASSGTNWLVVGGGAAIGGYILWRALR